MLPISHLGGNWQYLLEVNSPLRMALVFPGVIKVIITRAALWISSHLTEKDIFSNLPTTSTIKHPIGNTCWFPLNPEVAGNAVLGPVNLLLYFHARLWDCFRIETLIMKQNRFQDPVDRDVNLSSSIEVILTSTESTIGFTTDEALSYSMLQAGVKCASVSLLFFETVPCSFKYFLF